MLTSSSSVLAFPPVTSNIDFHSTSLAPDSSHEEHLKCDAVADLSPEIWSHVSLKESKIRWIRRAKEVITSLPLLFDIRDTQTTKHSAI
ncbi:hypothetical protein J6590_060029 [Homalodisca vitripennis]|nr:hypothetical protein J6590_060029 [Homalodisca vitripennis]